MNRSIYQARLGTNIGQVEREKRRFLLQDLRRFSRVEEVTAVLIRQTSVRFYTCMRCNVSQPELLAVYQLLMMPRQRAGGHVANTSHRLYVMHAPPEHLFFEFSLCLSRACLGEMCILYIIYKWLQKIGA